MDDSTDASHSRRAVPSARVLSRPSLVERLSAARVAVVAAPGGFGKSTLCRELATSLGCTEARVELEPGTTADVLVGAMAAAARRAGLAEMADLVGGATVDAAVDTVVAWLGRRAEPVLWSIDDVHHLDTAGWGVVEQLAANLPAPHRLVLAGRQLPADVRLPDDAAWVRGDDLRFDAADVAALAAGQLDDRATATLLELSDGWPAATAMAVERLRRGPTGVIRRAAGRDVLGQLLAELLAPLAPAVRAVAAAVARLPLFTEDLVDELLEPGSFAALRGSGLPLVRRADGWWELADPIREALADAPLTAQQAGVAARYYADMGDLSLAFAVLDTADGRDAFAAVLADRPWRELDDLGLASVRAAAELLGDDRLRRHPRLAVKLAWVAEGRDIEFRRRLLAVADQVTDGVTDSATGGDAHPLRATVLAERARDLVRFADVDGAEPLAREAMRVAADGDVVARARALFVLGHANTFRCTPASLESARVELEQSLVLVRLARERTWEADIRLRLGYAVLFHGGHGAEASEHLAATLAILGTANRARAVVLTHYADVLDFLGRGGEAEAADHEALAIGRRLGDQLVQWYAAWSLANIASHRGDRDGTRRWVAEGERHAGAWLDRPNGTEYLIAAADLLAAVDDEDEVRRRYTAAIALAERDDMADALRPLTARFEAMYGDPATALETFAELEGASFAVESMRWVRRLIAAAAHLRLGDTGRATALVTEAYADAAAMGVPDLPERFEPHLVNLLAGCGPSAPAAPPGLRLRMLGGFRLEAGGDDVTPQPGQPAQLVKLLALRGSVPVDEMIDLLWPDADLTTGRSRLRNLLNRLRSRSGDVVQRDGELLVLASSVEVDAATFEALAAAALDAEPHLQPGAARLAVAAYGGALLPTDQFEDWAAAPRERLARRILRLHDLLADDAADRGDVDEAVRQLEAGAAIDPLDESRLVRAADLLLAGGGRLAARRMLDRAIAVLDELGLVPRGRAAALVAELGSVNGR